MAPPSGDRMTIGAVLAILQDEFPTMDVTISKIRFLESEGLVEPARTPTGYRKFSPADVDRLRYTLTMQRDNFLPLRVIREHLDKLDRGFEPAVVSDVDPHVPTPEVDDEASVATLGLVPEGAEVAMTATDLATESGLGIGEIINLTRMGIIAPTDGENYGRSALDLSRSIARLRDHGIESKHLSRVFTAAQRQSELVCGLVGPHMAGRGRDDEQFQAALSQAEQVLAELLRLQSMAMRDEIRAELGLA